VHAEVAKLVDALVERMKSQLLGFSSDFCEAKNRRCGAKRNKR